MSVIQYKGADIYYKVRGSGKKQPLVLLHGFLEDSRIWESILEEIEQQRQVICIDLPGHGNSGGIGKVHSMYTMARVVLDVVRHLDIEVFSVAGHSMGGYVGLEILENFPMLVQSIMLINSTPLADTVEKKEIRNRSVRLVQKNKEAYISMAISNLYPEKSKEMFSEEIEALKSRAMRMEAKNIVATLEGMKIRTNYLEGLKDFQRQKVIVAGKQDPILDINEIAQVSEACNCTFHALERGHNSYMEDMNNLRTIMLLID